MSILKIKVSEFKKNPQSGDYERKKVKYTQSNYGCLEDLALNHIDDELIKDYALDHCDVTDKIPLLKEPSPSKIDTLVLIQELKMRGYEILKCETLADTYKFKDLKEALAL